jgi:hypothetical protein
MSGAIPAGGGGVPGERVDGEGERFQVSGWMGGAVPGLKARANPDRSSAAEGKGCDRRAPSTPHGIYRVGLALPLQGREPSTTRALRSPAPLAAPERGLGVRSLPTPSPSRPGCRARSSVAG